MKNPKWIAGAFAIALGGMSQLASGTTVSVNFVGGQGGNGTGGGSGIVTGPAGYNNASNWNNAVPAAGSLPGAIDDSGAVAASVSWNSGNTWAATGAAPAGGGSATMMSGYLDNFGNAGNNATVTGLGSEFTSKGYDSHRLLQLGQRRHAGLPRDRQCREHFHRIRQSGRWRRHELPAGRPQRLHPQHTDRQQHHLWRQRSAPHRSDR